MIMKTLIRKIRLQLIVKIKIITSKANLKKKSNAICSEKDIKVTILTARGHNHQDSYISPSLRQRKENSDEKSSETSQFLNPFFVIKGI